MEIFRFFSCFSDKNMLKLCISMYCEFIKKKNIFNYINSNSIFIIKTGQRLPSQLVKYG
jgi:hypothetical protein